MSRLEGKAKNLPVAPINPLRGDAYSSERDALAPRWHTALLIAVILAVAGAGTLLASRGVTTPLQAAPRARVTAVYLPLIVVAWSMLLYVCRVGRPRNELPRLLGAKWTTFGRAGADIALGVSGWLLVKGFELVWVRLFTTGASASVTAMLPQTWTERLAWVLVSVSAGFCEEVVFRGYLQTQLTAFTGRASVAIVLQAALFGIAHGEQGIGAMLRIALYGLGFGLLARRRRSLLPGIACHVWTDVASGLLRV